MTQILSTQDFISFFTFLHKGSSYLMCKETFINMNCPYLPAMAFPRSEITSFLQDRLTSNSYLGITCYSLLQAHK